uniref:alpha/beta fold hydrolase n=1 Tax=uncultured Altererythrobacter sp. TaxID=500840 RepID=UPI0026123076|nr:alpha/beta hydrolase [uncultured Altererythrobacter sp.]
MAAIQTRADQVTLRDGTITYREVGQGRPMVFIHGLFLNGSVWDGVVQDLARQYRCIIPEWPLGAHWTPMNADADLSPIGAAKAVAEFLAALNLEDAVLVGGDFGAVVAKVAAARHNERIGALVITNCDALEVFPAKGFEYFAWLPLIPGGTWGMAKAMYHLEGLRQGQGSFGGFTRNPMPPEMTRTFVEPLAAKSGVRRDAAKMMRGMDKALTLALPAELQDAGVPVLIVWGEDDHLFPLDLGRRLRDAIGDTARIVEIPQAKAFVMWDAPAECARAVSNFLDSADMGAAA